MGQKIQVTEHIEIELKYQEIKVITSYVLFKIKVYFEEKEEIGDLLNTNEFEPLYELRFEAVPLDKIIFYGTHDIKEYKKNVTEIEKLFDFCYINRENLFKAIGIEGRLCEY